ncbi:hypothetical protein O6H91_09G006100 [Diphasiastrum complanatum]|uniref:Uncharacterized protein n=1 Tax=Diphasiastrum complanatum TaxID=34168 RepID=A0ACC2CKZ2_DIPCM|nr:hypothetical protein O6H91_09G006100 [Diphasiastrum complanatum]
MPLQALAIRFSLVGRSQSVCIWWAFSPCCILSFYQACLNSHSFIPSLSLCHTRTHTHTHTQKQFLGCACSESFCGIARFDPVLVAFSFSYFFSLFLTSFWLVSSDLFIKDYCVYNQVSPFIYIPNFLVFLNSILWI